MIEPILLGLTKSQWEFINSFSNWFSAFGTIAAVCVSLYLADRNSRPRVKVSIGHRLVIVPGTAGPYPEFIVFNIVNSGDRNIRVTNISWKVGLRKKRFAVPLFDELRSSPLPVELTHGQEASWFVPLAAREKSWLPRFAKDMLMPNFRVSCYTLRGQVSISTGHVFETKPERGLISKLKEVCKDLSKDTKVGVSF